MPHYQYLCDSCNTVIEAILPMTDYLLPESLPCQECNEKNCVHIYLSSPPSIGDPIRLGIRKPDPAFIHGVLERMQNSVPDRSEVGKDGKIKTKFVNFSKARFSPGRTI